MPKSLSGFKKQIWIQHGLPEVSEMGRRGVFLNGKNGVASLAPATGYRTNYGS